MEDRERSDLNRHKESREKGVAVGKLAPQFTELNNGVVSCSEAVRVALWAGSSETPPEPRLVALDSATHFFSPRSRIRKSDGTKESRMKGFSIAVKEKGGTVSSTWPYNMCWGVAVRTKKRKKRRERSVEEVERVKTAQAEEGRTRGRGFFPPSRRPWGGTG